MQFIVFKIDQETKTFERVVGPYFAKEVANVKELMFQGLGEPMVMEEIAFASRHPNEYRMHCTRHWMDKLRCYFVEQKDWIGDVFQNVEQHGFAASWFSIYDTQNGAGVSLKINIAVTANRFHECRLLDDIRRMFSWMKIELGSPYYNSGRMSFIGSPAGYTDDRRGAYQRYLAEKQVSEACYQ